MIKTERVRRGLTQTEVAHAVGITKAEYRSRYPQAIV